MDLLERDPENHRMFIDRLRGRVASRDLLLLADFAYDLAKYGHREQFRDSGEPYFEHCRETALILMDELGIFNPNLIITALLHDMLEDNFLLTTWRIAWIFGDRISEMVSVLTKPKKTDKRFTNDRERHEFYFQQIERADCEVMLIKLCDRLHNLRTLDQCAPEKRQRKIIETKEKYLWMLADIRYGDSPIFNGRAMETLLTPKFSRILAKLEEANRPNEIIE
ncbi:MAG: HD domain-containing protein [Patescibacteria group bacterium]